MKILITGGSGMVGRNFMDDLRVKNYTIFNPSSSELNLLNPELVNAYIKKYMPDMIIHMAAKVGGIHSNIANPSDYFSQNLEMGYNLISISRKNGIRKMINIGSSCMYPKNFPEPIKESDLLTGKFEETNEAYAMAKVSIAKYCEFISSEKGYNYKTVIPCNLYGKYDKFSDKNSHMVAAVIKKIFKAKSENKKYVEIWGDGSVRREFMYAADFSDFIFFSIENFDKIPQYLNVGLGKDYSVLDYYKLTAELLEYKGEFEFNLNAPVGMKRKLVNSKLVNSLGWTYNTNLKLGLSNTINYYINYEI